MNVSHYAFGTITIDGQTYTSDVIIYPDRVDASWWRKEGHSLSIADISDIIRERPDVLVIGTGAYGVMKVPGETLSQLRLTGIEVQVAKTAEAVALLNKLGADKKVIATLHLTC